MSTGSQGTDDMDHLCADHVHSAHHGLSAAAIAARLHYGVALGNVRRVNVARCGSKIGRQPRSTHLKVLLPEDDFVTGLN